MMHFKITCQEKSFVYLRKIFKKINNFIKKTRPKKSKEFKKSNKPITMKFNFRVRIDFYFDSIFN